MWPALVCASDKTSVACKGIYTSYFGPSRTSHFHGSQLEKKHLDLTKNTFLFMAMRQQWFPLMFGDCGRMFSEQSYSRSAWGGEIVSNNPEFCILLMLPSVGQCFPVKRIFLLSLLTFLQLVYSIRSQKKNYGTHQNMHKKSDKGQKLEYT